MINGNEKARVVSELKNLPNRWIRNYWNDENRKSPYIIRKIIILPFRDASGIYYRILWFECDWLPAQEPYDIPVGGRDEY